MFLSQSLGRFFFEYPFIYHNLNCIGYVGLKGSVIVNYELGRTLKKVVMAYIMIYFERLVRTINKDILSLDYGDIRSTDFF
jgi:hypothetical protein